MYIISQMESGKCFGEVLENGYYTEGNTFFEVEEDLIKHDIKDTEQKSRKNHILSGGDYESNWNSYAR